MFYRYAIAEYETKAEAEQALEDMCAEGEVSELEAPRVERSPSKQYPFAIVVEAVP